MAQENFENSLIGESPELNSVIWAAKITAASDVTVLVQGESGCGKEVFAKVIHNGSKRNSQKLVSVNCAAIPENLAESMLFGHIKGSFTGALANQDGYIQSSDKGTLFLDEIGELPLSVQAKLLRFLESSECQKVGSTTTEKVDVRVIAATNRDLRDEIKKGNFREDLFYRLHIVPLEIPPLRERTGDLQLLLNHFTQSLAVQYDVEPPVYSKSAIKCLKAYSWPGNVRELRNLCERMSILLAGKTIDIDNLPAEIKNAQRPMQDTFVSLPDTGLSLEKVEIELIRQALDKTSGNQSRAARLLGLTRDTLLYRMKKYALN
ncbi:MAG: sigma-54 dependent transcriptional regulator [gamma proteobacterium symbiont of Bathyaustriella thionipta]|nr:sigma-54 dependent transcriptional regulator [gamma proteobacterium symbiont of Bathyaustriella thionipta]MCU7948615.1 sigma-54 dependent transcriptional regulator [gamma proteobacterium symbiont of Bathyaustriella thionipta]MCU7952880.1 sigma-54 dependent transcriptional regulator [gamma proteobacterium symbiont of Bathyaustriella thionipta]MCU7955134.1 sigma-54 dependent transcriptional regulator [gamma proteobacterium symbiont of Bathyaustriella thionipta]MCU7968878.1 sigma-54 dependent t